MALGPQIATRSVIKVEADDRTFKKRRSRWPQICSGSLYAHESRASGSSTARLVLPPIQFILRIIFYQKIRNDMCDLIYSLLFLRIPLQLGCASFSSIDCSSFASLYSTPTRTSLRRARDLMICPILLCVLMIYHGLF